MPSPEKFLVERIEIEEIRKVFRIDEEFIVNADEKDLVLYKKIQKERLKFISKYERGDEIWIYNYPDKYWKNLMGRKGFVIMRNGKMIDHFMSMCN